MVDGGIDIGYKEDIEQLHQLFQLEFPIHELKILFGVERCVKGRELV